jgi:hypothetical protein
MSDEPDPHPDTPPPFVPLVFLATPHYGAVSMGLYGTLKYAVKDRSLIEVVREGQSASSVLPHAFNDLFAAALDCRDRGEVTHFAMAHADICARPGWLDTLYCEMWYHDAACVSAVVPLKDHRGRTSTAVGLEADPWAARCLTMADRDRLPPTFGPGAVCKPGEVLLVNTGLMLLDLRWPGWDDFAFQFHTRITRTPAGRRADHRSEDWEMSHYLHRHKAHYLATWKPKLDHEGSKKYPNYPE